MNIKVDNIHELPDTIYRVLTYSFFIKSISVSLFFLYFILSSRTSEFYAITLNFFLFMFILLWFVDGYIIKINNMLKLVYKKYWQLKGTNKSKHFIQSKDNKSLTWKYLLLTPGISIFYIPFIIFIVSDCFI